MRMTNAVSPGAREATVVRRKHNWAILGAQWGGGVVRADLVASLALVGLTTALSLAAQAADVSSVICSERASAERLFGVIMELPSVQADADMSAFESAYQEEVAAGRCVAGDFPATGGELVRHPEGGAYFGIVDLGDDGYAIEFDLAFFNAF